MKPILISIAVLMSACAQSPSYDLANQVLRDIPYKSHNWFTDGPDVKVFGCSDKGDCDDRALCTACRLVKNGAQPAEITVVLQGWSNFDRRASSNHMSLEYKGECILGYGSTAYEGQCKHWWSDKDMKTVRMPLPAYLAKVGAVNKCGEK